MSLQPNFGFQFPLIYVSWTPTMNENYIIQQFINQNKGKMDYWKKHPNREKLLQQMKNDYDVFCKYRFFSQMKDQKELKIDDETKENISNVVQYMCSGKNLPLLFGGDICKEHIYKYCMYRLKYLRQKDNNSQKDEELELSHYHMGQYHLNHEFFEEERKYYQKMGKEKIFLQSYLQCLNKEENFDFLNKGNDQQYIEVNVCQLLNILHGNLSYEDVKPPQEINYMKTSYKAKQIYYNHKKRSGRSYEVEFQQSIQKQNIKEGSSDKTTSGQSEDESEQTDSEYEQTNESDTSNTSMSETSKISSDYESSEGEDSDCECGCGYEQYQITENKDKSACFDVLSIQNCDDDHMLSISMYQFIKLNRGNKNLALYYKDGKDVKVLCGYMIDDQFIDKKMGHIIDKYNKNNNKMDKNRMDKNRIDRHETVKHKVYEHGTDKHEQTLDSHDSQEEKLDHAIDKYQQNNLSSDVETDEEKQRKEGTQRGGYKDSQQSDTQQVSKNGVQGLGISIIKNALQSDFLRNILSSSNQILKHLLK